MQLRGMEIDKSFETIFIETSTVWGRGNFGVSIRIFCVNFNNVFLVILVMKITS